MTAVNEIKNTNNNFKIFLKPNDNIGKFSDKLQKDKFISKKLSAAETYQNIGDGLSRPIKINSSNGTFFINHNAQNKSVKIEAGEYNLRELQAALKQKVNEQFGINQISVKLTAAGKDRLLYAEDKKKENKMDLEA